MRVLPLAGAVQEGRQRRPPRRFGRADALGCFLLASAGGLSSLRGHRALLAIRASKPTTQQHDWI